MPQNIIPLLLALFIEPTFAEEVEEEIGVPCDDDDDDDDDDDVISSSSSQSGAAEHIDDDDEEEEEEDAIFAFAVTKGSLISE